MKLGLFLLMVVGLSASSRTVFAEDFTSSVEADPGIQESYDHPEDTMFTEGTDSDEADDSSVIISEYLEPDSVDELPDQEDQLEEYFIKDGLVPDSDGIMRYYRDGEFCPNYSGIAYWNHNGYFVANGIVCSEANGLNMYDGEWYYLTNGEIDTSVSGLVPYDNHLFYFWQGRLWETYSGMLNVTRDYTKEDYYLLADGMVLENVSGLWGPDYYYFRTDGSGYYEQVFWYLDHGHWQEDYTGLAEYNSEYFYVENGLYRKNVSDVKKIDGEYYKFTEGQLQRNFSGWASDSDGTTYCFINGKAIDVDTTMTGLRLDEDGIWRYYINGEFCPSFSGITEYDGERFFVANGILCSEASGLNQYDGIWYYLEGGQIQSQYTGFVPYNGRQFLVRNGIADLSLNGFQELNGELYYLGWGAFFPEYSGYTFLGDKMVYVKEGRLDSDLSGFTGTFMFKDGSVDRSFDGLHEIDGTLKFFSYGIFDTDYCGIWEGEDGNKYYVWRGEVDKNLNGLVSENPKYAFISNYYVVKNGIVQTDYTGTYEYNGRQYDVVNGRVTNDD